ncbi:hypothetical protein C806_03007 [Lachnospiraceae bacterium 3-1]|nr:hypothetical protein C806_03007 [Lachnospiraceae bacterium 3-1]
MYIHGFIDGVLALAVLEVVALVVAAARSKKK